jgi:hypothetical protein
VQFLEKLKQLVLFIERKLDKKVFCLILMFSFELAFPSILLAHVDDETII